MVNRVLSQIAFFIVAVALFGAPWFFGSWEMWWFWPFAGLLILAALLQSLRLCLYALHRPSDPAAAVIRLPTGTQRHLLLGFGLFLAYAVVRVLQAPVPMDAERSLLLFLLPLLIGVQVVFGFNGRQRRFLYWMLAANLALLGLYGVANHFITENRLVLWAPGFPIYVADHRATGTFYCPDHFAGAMELAVGLGLGLILARRSSGLQRLAGLALATPALAGILLSKSRGAGLTLIVVAIGITIWAWPHLPTRARWWARLSVLCFSIALILTCTITAKSYTQRFGAYFHWKQARQQPLLEAITTMRASTQRHYRARIYSAAYRAWLTAPWFGIGAGMHAAMWPHIAPSADANRELGIRPRFSNHEYNATQAHSDWLQLLEEYGALGLVLFLIPAGIGLRRLHHLNREAANWPADTIGGFNVAPDALTLAALLAITAMAFHSLGDFNLQIPAINWIFAAIVSLPLVRA